MAGESGDRFALVGTVLDGKYRVERVVAEGGFGVVYAGHHLSLDVPVAVKVLKTPPDLSEAARAEFVDKFLREAKTIARMRHPNIVQVLDTAVSTMPSGEKTPYAVLEWLTGDTLEELLAARRDKPVAKAEAFALMKPVLDALAYAHEERIAHRDVKPGNIMLVPTRRGVSVRLLDFGIAKIMGENESAAGTGFTRTHSARITYSPAYAAPEQLASARTGPWTDVHALGLIFTELLTGTDAYPARDTTELFSIAMAPERPTPKKRGVDVGDWEPILAKALALRPEERHADAGELSKALGAALGGDVQHPTDVGRLLAMLPHFRSAIGHADTLPSHPDLSRYVGPDASGAHAAATISGPHAAATISGAHTTIDAKTLSSTETAVTRDGPSPPPAPRARSVLPVVAGAGALFVAVVGAGLIWSRMGASPPAATASAQPLPPPAASTVFAPTPSSSPLPTQTAQPSITASVRKPVQAPVVNAAPKPSASVRKGTEYTLE